MEMHQVRYFLAVARTLNFTRAAEECNVAQPSLTRAIRQLEDELGGDLFRRERPHAQLTELGQRMQPLLQQCYDSALGARSLASSIKSGEVGSLRIAVSATIETALLMPYILELRKLFKRLEVKLMRGTTTQVAEFMKTGSAELAIASSLGDAWDRLDTWPLFSEGFVLVVGTSHRLAGRNSIQLSDVRSEALLMRIYAEYFESLSSVLRSHGFPIDRAHEMPSEHDLEAFPAGFWCRFRAAERVVFGLCEASSRHWVGSSAHRVVIRRCRPATHAGCQYDCENAASSRLVTLRCVVALALRCAA